MGQPQLLAGAFIIFSSSYPSQPTSPTYNSPISPVAGFALPVPGRTQKRKAFRNPIAHILLFALRGFAV